MARGLDEVECSNNLKTERIRSSILLSFSLCFEAISALLNAINPQQATCMQPCCSQKTLLVCFGMLFCLKVKERI